MNTLYYVLEKLQQEHRNNPRLYNLDFMGEYMKQNSYIRVMMEND